MALSIETDKGYFLVVLEVSFLAVYLRKYNNMNEKKMEEIVVMFLQIKNLEIGSDTNTDYNI